ARPQLGLLLAACEPRDVLVDVDLAVEAEVVRVGAEEAPDVRLARQSVELLVLEGAQVLRAYLRRLLGLEELEVPPLACLAQAVADLEHREPDSRLLLPRTAADGRSCGGDRQAVTRHGAEA